MLAVDPPHKRLDQAIFAAHYDESVLRMTSTSANQKHSRHYRIKGDWTILMSQHMSIALCMVITTRPVVWVSHRRLSVGIYFWHYTLHSGSDKKTV